MLNIQKFIKAHSFVLRANIALKADFGIDAKEEKIEPCQTLTKTVFVYNYKKELNKLDSEVNAICKEANGVILDMNGGIVSLPIPHVYKQFEKNADTIDWSSAVAQELLDGTLVTVYNCEGTFFIQTTGSAVANEKVPYRFSNTKDDLRLTYRELVESLLRAKFGVDPFKEFNRNNCYIFELVSEFNRKVIKYEKAKLVLLAITNKVTGDELTRFEVDEFAKRNNLERPRTHIVSDVSEVSPLMHELGAFRKGYVIIDAKGNRVKFQNAFYDDIYDKIKPGVQKLDRDWARIALSSECSKIRAYFPEYEKIVGLFHQTMIELVEEAIDIWRKHNLKPMNEFIGEARKCPLFFPLLLLKKEKITNIAEGVDGLNPTILAKETEKRHWSALSRIKYDVDQGKGIVI
jgi:hypothetical protein